MANSILIKIISTCNRELFVIRDVFWQTDESTNFTGVDNSINFKLKGNICF